jgi:hypothetical protein
MPYPVSTLSPPITPNDLTSFKTRGLSQVERDLKQKLKEMHESYVALVDQYNWNKLVYESEIRFEPIVGEIYHLYRIRESHALSMVSPEQWFQPHVASLRLTVGRQWEVVAIGRGVDPAELFGKVRPENGR